MGIDYYRCWRASSAELMSDRNYLQSIMLGGSEETGSDCAVLVWSKVQLRLDNKSNKNTPSVLFYSRIIQVAGSF